jgi:hypothetical protein
MSERRAAAAPPASRCEPDGSHSNTRTGRDRTRIETDGLISRPHNLLPNSPDQRSFACPLCPKTRFNLIIMTKLLRSCCGRATVGGKFIETSQSTHHR